MLKRSLLNFMAVVRRGSIRAAAAELGIVQSAISRQLQGLEHELGTPILERNTRGIRLTPAGRLLYAHGQKALFKTERFHSELDAFRGFQGGHVAFSAVESLASHLLPRIVSTFSRTCPEVTLAVDVASTGDVIRSVADGIASFGVCFSALPMQGVETVVRYREPLLAVVPRGHPLADRRSVGLLDLLPHSIAMSTRNTGVGLLLDLACRKAGVAITAALETNSLELLRQFVGHGAGVAVMTRQSCIEGLDDDGCVAVALEDAALNSGSIDVVVASGRALPLPAERVIEELQRQLLASSASGLAGHLMIADVPC